MSAHPRTQQAAARLMRARRALSGHMVHAARLVTTSRKRAMVLGVSVFLAIGGSGLGMSQANSKLPALRLSCGAAPSPLCAALNDQIAAQVKGRYDLTLVEPGAQTPVAASDLGLALEIEKQGDGWIMAHIAWEAGQNGHSGRGPSLELSAMDAPLTPAMYTRFATDMLRVDEAMAALLAPRRDHTK